MSDDARSVATKKPRKRRVLVISNVSPESSSDGEAAPSEPQPKPHGVPPRPLPSPSRSHPREPVHPEHAYNTYGNIHVPPVVTSNLYGSRSSNPSISSPSSTSSPAVESTPPPSTPGLNSSTPPFSDDGTLRPKEFTPVLSDRIDSTPQPPRPRFVNSQLPNQTRRDSFNGSRPANSPTVSNLDSYMPHTFRANTMERVNVLVTTDAENLHLVDITGAMTPAFIRERIFTKLQVSDEDQSNFSIYLTEVGQYAIGDALTDEELFELYRERGDSNGTLKLLVSHSSASVHEPAAYERLPTSTVNTIPPPVLPQMVYAPLQPNRRRRIRQGSQSSASEPHHAETGGYEASVSDDLDRNDDSGPRDGRDYCRNLHSRALPTPMNRPPSPAGYHRSRSPAALLSPDRTVLSPDSHMPRVDPYHSNVSTPQISSASPQNPRDLTHPLPLLPPDAISPPTDSTQERERTYTNESQGSSYAGRYGGPKDRDVDSNQRRRELRKGGTRYPKDHDAWTLVPSDIPSSSYTKDRPTTPQESRGTSRYPMSPPSVLSPYRPGSGAGDAPRRKPVKVPSNWAVNWKHSMGPNKNDKSAPAPSPSLMRHTAKSMSDMRGAFKHPANLQPGRGSRAPPPQPPLPLLARPSTGGTPGVPSLPSAASSSGDTLSAHPEFARSPDVVRSAMPPTGYPRQIPSPYANSSATNAYLGSPPQDPYPRPHSALGDSGTTASTQPRYMHSPQNSETSYDSVSQRSLGYGTSMSTSYRDDHMRPPPSHLYSEQHAEFFTNTTDYSRGPRTPPRSPIGTSSSSNLGQNGFQPSSVPNELPGAAFAKRGAFDEDNGSHTMRPDDRKWVEGFIDEENAGEGTATARPRPKPRLDAAQQLPTPPPTLEMTALTASAASTLVNSFRDSRNSDLDSDSDEDHDGGTIWAKKPPKVPEPPLPSEKLRMGTRPPLAPLVFPSSETNASTSSGNDYGRSPPPNFPPPPDTAPPPRTPKRTPATRGRPDRISKFDNNVDFTWAPRPPPEVMYDRLEEYFPEHDLDKPVIDAPSGGASPTATEAPAAPPLRSKRMKSIRVVAAEHKRQMDRTSRGESSTVAPASRKRHTKLWGSKLEEVTTQQGKGPVSSASSDSSPGGTKQPIFRWVRGELIGKGTYGRVYLALNATTGEMIAVKQVEIPRTASDKDDSRQVSVVEALKLESETLSNLDHPNIVQYLGYEETPTFLSIFLEYVPGGSIASCLRKHGRFDEEVTKSFTGQILSGLEYLHSRGILHRDLKADNILVETTGVCKISDFGISKRTDDINIAAAYTSMQGTVFWMAPEVINSKGKGYNSKIDIWSMGCVVFEMWTGQRPWSGQEAMAVLIHLYSNKQAPPVPDGIVLSSLADDFRLKCFAEDPDERPTAAELRKHSYLELQPGWSFVGFK